MCRHQLATSGVPIHSSLNGAMEGWGQLRSACLRNRHCRGNMSVQDWCNDGWAKGECGWTCCRANLLRVDLCSAGQCQQKYRDAWNPQWPDKKANSAACLRCMREPSCRGHWNEKDWCSRLWASDHCALTCCIEGHIAEPSQPSIQI